jgi:PAS domain S-box-containing protein
LHDEILFNSPPTCQARLVRSRSPLSADGSASGNPKCPDGDLGQLRAELSAILESVIDGITVQDRGGALVYANPSAARICGFSSVEEMLSATGQQILARFEMLDERGNLLDPQLLPGRIAMGGEQPEPAMIHVRLKSSGREWWALARATPVFGPDGQVERVVNVWHDVTRVRRHELGARYLVDVSAVLASSLDYATTLEKLAEILVPELCDWCAIHVLDGTQLKAMGVAHVDAGKVASARELQKRYPRSMAEKHGPAEVVRTGKSQLHPVITDETLVRTSPDEAYLQTLRNLGLCSAMIVPIKVRDRTLGTMTLTSAESNWRYDEHDLIVAEEVGRRAGIAIENARLYEEARSAIQLRDDFLSVAGHELKTPLAALYMQLTNLARAFELGSVASDLPSWAARAKKAVEYCDRVNRLVQDLLDVSRITSGRYGLESESCDVAEIVRKVVERLSEDFGKIGSVVTFSASGDTTSECDPSRLDQIMTNLLANAMKYGRGKPIEVSVEGEHREVVVNVRDHGIGIAPEDKTRIFGRFQRAVPDSHYGGFGLGLWIVSQLVEAHGGRVWFESALGDGSKFSFALPRIAT